MVPRLRRRTGLVSLACALLAAGAGLAGCGGAASQGTAARTVHRPAPRTAPLPFTDPQSRPPGGWSPAQRAERRRFFAQVEATCRELRWSPLDVNAADAHRRAGEVEEERAQLRALARALRGLAPPPPAQLAMALYENALRAQILLDGIVVRGLRTGDGEDAGATAGESQAQIDRARRAGIAARQGFAACSGVTRAGG